MSIMGIEEGYIVRSLKSKALIRFGRAIHARHNQVLDNPCMYTDKSFLYTEFCKKYSKEYLINKAKEMFYTTSDPLKAFWLLEDGSLTECNGPNLRGSHSSIWILFKDDEIVSNLPLYARIIFFTWRTNSIRLRIKNYKDGYKTKLGLGIEIWINIEISDKQWSKLRFIISMLDNPKIFYDICRTNKIVSWNETVDLNEVRSEYYRLKYNKHH